MPDYRAYIVDRDGHFLTFSALECADDEDAKQQAQQLVDGHDVELWQRDRKVMTFPRKDWVVTVTKQEDDRNELQRRLEQAFRIKRLVILSRKNASLASSANWKTN
jgi:hypothetical protein